MDIVTFELGKAKRTVEEMNNDKDAVVKRKQNNGGTTKGSRCVKQKM